METRKKELVSQKVRAFVFILFLVPRVLGHKQNAVMSITFVVLRPYLVWPFDPP